MGRFAALHNYLSQGYNHVAKTNAGSNGGFAMLKTLLSISALTLIGFVTPATAQMCGAPGTQAQASPKGGGMMCGMMGQAQAKPEGETQKPQASGMCPCCRNMAMMHRGKPGGTMHHDMPGMEMPKQ